jgi:hypothetical protein
MKWNLYALAFLTLWTQIDDQLLAPATQVQAAPLASDSDDEFLPVARPAHQDQVSHCRSPESFGAIPPAVMMSCIGAPHIPTTFISTSLYIFMSLQI